MNKAPFTYFMSTLFDKPKFIKTRSGETEIIQEINGKMTIAWFPSEYPTSSDENLEEISAEKYNRIRIDVIKTPSHVCI